MLASKRNELIINLLRSKGSVDIHELASECGVSTKTIRLDLEKLQEEGFLERVHGGAVLKTNDQDIYNIAMRRDINTDAKIQIARTAFGLIEAGDIIYLDDGSTTAALARLLGDKHITVITHDLNIATILLNKINVDVFIIGGKLQREGRQALLSGDEAMTFILNHHANKLFLGTSSINEKDGLMIYYYGDSMIKRSCINISDHVYCLADHSKLNETAFLKFCDIKELDALITDTQADPIKIKNLRKAGLEVIIAKENN